jgi:hypothetical protein
VRKWEQQKDILYRYVMTFAGNNSEARRDRGKRYTVRIRDKGNNRPNQDDIKAGRNRPGNNLRRQEEIKF